MTGIELESLTLAKAAAKKYLNDKIDWEQRRYEIAKELMPHFLSLWLPDKDGKWEVRHNKEMAAKESVSYADALIEELRKPKK